MFRSAAVLGCVGVLYLGSSRLCAEDSFRAAGDNKSDADRQLVYNVEGLT